MDAVQDYSGRERAEGDLVLVPCRVVRVAGANGRGCRVQLQTEEPPEGELWPVLAVPAGRAVVLAGESEEVGAC